MAPTPILIGVGSNLEPHVHVPEGIARLREVFSHVRISTFYWTRPLQGRRQPPYANGVIAAETEKDLEAVHAILADVERVCGRIRIPGDRYASRTLDLDLLAYGDTVDAAHSLPDDDLVERDFVLLPAAELWPHWHHPILGETLAALAAQRTPTWTDITGVAELPLP